MQTPQFQNTSITRSPTELKNVVEFVRELIDVWLYTSSQQIFNDLASFNPTFLFVFS